ncbi:type II secretion system GspH family protein [Patescibacteria group bacterium]|nr:type II secretion system GspH family protein [Patescibacteria group bacterium]
MRTSHSKAFTLIELLIVVAIIGLLAAIITVTVAGAISKGRDARRIADLNTMRTAMYQYYTNNNGSFPSVGASTTCNNASFASLSASLVTAGILQSNLVDPLNSGNYLYYAAENTSSFVLGAELENSSNPALLTSVAPGNVPSGLTCNTTTAYNTCVNGQNTSGSTYNGYCVTQ